MIGTTSCGRVLDAVAAVLGVCYERTYEGEPAMKLESLAMRGKNALNLRPRIEGFALDTTGLLLEVFEKRDEMPKADLALSAHIYLAEGLASLALRKANDNGVGCIGFTGGVALNEIVTSKMRDMVESSGLRFLVLEAVPAGDGGTSFGQAVVAGLCAS